MDDISFFYGENENFVIEKEKFLIDSCDMNVNNEVIDMFLKQLR